MGYSYGQNPLTGRWSLCCDKCGSCTGELGRVNPYERIKSVKKMACPYGWCPATATCNQCMSKGEHRIEFHQDCKQEELKHDRNAEAMTQLGLDNGQGKCVVCKWATRLHSDAYQEECYHKAKAENLLILRRVAA